MVQIKKLIIILMLMCLLPLVVAETEIYKRNELIDLKFTCTLNNAIPSALTEYNITISYPNGTTFLNNVATTARGNGAFNYTTNFTELGTYKVLMFCYDGTYSYSGTGDYEITNNGNDAPEGIVIVLFSIIFLIIVGFLLYSLILSIGHLASLDLDVVDLAKSFGIYFVFLGFYILSRTYMGNPDVERFTLLFIQIGGFTHLIFPIIAFVLSITIGGLKKKKVEFGINRIYRRQKIGN